MDKLRVAITGFDARENAYPGLALSRALKADPELDVEIVALTYNLECSGIYCRDAVDEVRVCPYPIDPERIWLDYYRELQAEAPVQALLPALDTEIAVHARLASRLRELGIATLLPSEAVVKSRNKTALAATCRRLGFDSPHTIALNDLKQIDRLEEEFHFPVFIKGSIVDARKCNSVPEARFHYLQVLARWGYPVLVQQAIVGEEYDVVALADRESELVAAIPMRKAALTARGKAFAGITLDDPELIDFARRLLSKLHWVGPCELELMREASTGHYHILEINARFPAWIYLSVTAGLNMPALALRLALGEPPPGQARYDVGALYYRNVSTGREPLDRFAALLTEGVAR